MTIQHKDEIKNRALEERERQLRHVNQQLEISEEVIALFERRIAKLEQEIYQRDKLSDWATVKLRWRERKRMPSKMCRWSDAVVDDSAVYVRNEDRREIYSYDITSGAWSQLPKCVDASGPIVLISGYLTTVGGYDSNELFSLTGKGSGGKWTKKFPPMPTKRHWTTALCTETMLIVAGGCGVCGEVLSTVEVMNTENYQWYTAADLPESMHKASATVCGGRIYVLGGTDGSNIYTKSIYTCYFSALLQSCKLSSPGAHLEKISSVDRAITWSKVTDLPVTRSTCVSFHGRLLAIGGVDSGLPTTAVYIYCSSTRSWGIISHMVTG